MATVTETEAPKAGATDPDYDLSVDEFFRMIEAGCFPRESRVYLWDGRLRERMARTAAHAAVSSAFLHALARRLPPGWYLGAENPIRLGPRHAPLPDLSAIHGEPLVFLDRNRYAEPREVGLIVEIAVTSLPKDLGERCEHYAGALVPTYWVADVHGRRVVTHEGPRVEDGRGRYDRGGSCGPGQSLALTLGGLPVAPIPYEELMR